MVTGNAHLINLLCQNLMNNGFYHGTSSTMTIYRSQNIVIFENALSGTQAKPHYQGLGHGQYLVKRIVNMMQWEINTEQIDGAFQVKVATR